MWNARIYSKRASVCCAKWIALSVEGVYCMTEFFWKQLLDEVRVKIILISSSRWWRFVTATSAIGLIVALVMNTLLTFTSCSYVYSKPLRDLFPSEPPLKSLAQRIAIIWYWLLSQATEQQSLTGQLGYWSNRVSTTQSPNTGLKNVGKELCDRCFNKLLNKFPRGFYQ